MLFGLAGNIDNFPNREVGFGIFLIGLFATTLLLFGKVD